MKGKKDEFNITSFIYYHFSIVKDRVYGAFLILCSRSWFVIDKEYLLVYIINFKFHYLIIFNTTKLGTIFRR